MTELVAEVGCVFCPANWPKLDIVEKWVGGAVAIVKPLNPVTEGHALVIYRHHDESVAATADATSRAAVLMKVAAGYISVNKLSANIITSIGADATQTVFHTHLHIVPRRPDDGLALPWTGQKLREAAIIRTVEQLDALPDGSIVRDADGEAWKRDGSCEIGEAWFRAGGECDYPADRVPLPALVLWTPEAVTGG